MALVHSVCAHSLPGPVVGISYSQPAAVPDRKLCEQGTGDVPVLTGEAKGGIEPREQSKRRYDFPEDLGIRRTGLRWDGERVSAVPASDRAETHSV